MVADLPEAVRQHYPWTGRRIDVGGRALHVLDVGSGRPLLFVHGNPTWSFYWRTLVGPLSVGHRCVAVDHLGCGLSDRVDGPVRLADHIANLVAVIDDLDLRDATLVVHDWGGPIGFGALLQRRDRFRNAVAFNTSLFHGPVPLEIRACRWPVVGPFLLQTLNGFVRVGQYRAIANQDRMRNGVGDGYLFPWHHDRAAVQRFVDDIPIEADHPTRTVIDGIDAATATLADLPVCLIWGMRDFCFTPAFLDGMIRRFPHAEVHRLNDAAHYVVEDAHEHIVPVIRGFVDR